MDAGVTGGHHRATAGAVVAHDRAASAAVGNAAEVGSLRRNGAQDTQTAGERARVSGDPRDEILKLLSEDFIRKMDNWARSLDGGSVSTCSNLWGNVGGGGGRGEARMPVLMGEATDTDKAIRALPPHEQECVAIFWMHRWQSVAWMCEATPSVRLWNMTSAWFVELCQRGHSMLTGSA